ncbi:hypothetical protein BDR07DRAFT_1399736 [Suillus spraguei]|nr:hypothetical protein BDR07DRAFT_1428749 [Suillus spraguei]KAG2365073.1 hypothetical protein BDR07DRAFT_1399736 [Suillus spraguei]
MALLVSLSDSLRTCCFFFSKDELLFFCEKASLGALFHGFESACALLLCASVKDI